MNKETVDLIEDVSISLDKENNLIEFFIKELTEYKRDNSQLEPVKDLLIMIFKNFKNYNQINIDKLDVAINAYYKGKEL